MESSLTELLDMSLTTLGLHKFGRKCLDISSCSILNQVITLRLVVAAVMFG